MKYNDWNVLSIKTRNVIFPQGSKNEEYCGAMAVNFEWNEHWKVKHLNLSIGISGDFDGRNYGGNTDDVLLNEWNVFGCGGVQRIRGTS